MLRVHFKKKIKAAIIQLGRTMTFFDVSGGGFPRRAIRDQRSKIKNPRIESQLRNQKKMPQMIIGVRMRRRDPREGREDQRSY